MARKTRHEVVLRSEECARLRKIIRSGRHPARTINRCRILLLINNGKSDEEIRKELDIGKMTPYQVRRRLSTGGIERAIYDAPRTGQPRTLNAKEEAKVVAMACTEPPEGHGRWTVDLLEERVQREVRAVGRTTIYNILLRNELQPWREKNVVREHHH